MQNETLSTKERIISSAFSFYDRVIIEKISLSMIARKAGITKSAIYKHFKSKEELEGSMLEKLYDDLYSVISKLEDNEPAFCYKTMEDMIVLLFKKKEYLYYLMSTHVKFSIDQFLIGIEKKGSRIFGGLFDKDGSVTNWELYMHLLYLSITVIVFQVSRDEELKKTGIQDSDEKIRSYAKKIVSIIKFGLSEIQEVSLFRLSELDMKCSENFRNLPETDRFFKALSNVVAEVGFRGVTVEAVAKELGIAKSSLYSKFTDKDDLLYSNLEKEVRMMFEVMKKNITFAECREECIYILMKTELDYFITHKEVFIVSKWLQFQNDFEFSKNEGKCFFDEFHSYLCSCGLLENLPDTGEPSLSNRTFFSWFFSIPVFLCMHAKKHNLPIDMINAALKDIFYIMLKGEYSQWEKK